MSGALLPFPDSDGDETVRRTRSEPRVAPCAWCTMEYTQRRHGAFCSDICRKKAWNAKQERLREEEARKAEGLRKGAENNAHQREEARKAALKCFAAQGGRGIVSDVRKWCEKREIELEWWKPWTGSLFQHEWFQGTGAWKPAYHAGSSARPVREWKLTDEGWAALESGDDPKRNRSEDGSK